MNFEAEKFTFEDVAKYSSEGQISIWTDGLLVSTDDDYFSSFRMVAGKSYRVTIEEIETDER